jgi:hypothetical protein
MAEKRIFSVQTVERTPGKGWRVGAKRTVFAERTSSLHRQGAAFAEPVGPTSMSPAQVQVVDPVLTTVALGYKNQRFVGDAVFPRVPVEIRAGQILQFGMEDFKSYNLKRSPGADTERISFGYQGTPFACVQDAVEVAIPREFQQTAEVMPGIDLGSRAVRRAMNIILKSLEYDQAQLAIGSGNYEGNTVALSGSSQWDNAGDASSDPVEQILDLIQTVRAQTGMEPNTVTFGPLPWIGFKRHPVVRDQYKYTSPASVTTAMITELLEVEQVTVGKSVTADDLNNVSDIWGNNVVLSYSPRELSAMEEPSFGYTYAYKGTPYAEPPYWDPRAKSWVYGVTMDRIPVLTGISTGYLIQSPVGASD